MRIDFYGLGQSQADAVLPALAGKVRAEGHRLLVVEGDEERRSALSRTLWEARPELFLANGLAGEPHEARQPILISGDVLPVNGADRLCLADGRWREPAPQDMPFERVFYLFGDAQVEEARSVWRDLGRRDTAERHFWKRDASGRWREGP